MELLNFTYCLLYTSKSQFECFTEEEFEDTKGVIRIRKSKKDKQHNSKQKGKNTNTDPQNITHKTKDRVARTPIKTGVELRCSGRVGSYCSTSGTRRVTLVTKPVISYG
jgi:hypothetical protein